MVEDIRQPAKKHDLIIFLHKRLVCRAPIHKANRGELSKSLFPFHAPFLISAC